jgi:hypothetical protein
MFLAGSNMEDAMSDEGMTAHELRCFEHLKQARALGMSSAQYARAHGLKARMLYDAEKQLRKKGVIASVLPSKRPAKSSAEGRPEIGGSQFVAVRIARPSVPTSPCLPVLRVQHARGHVLEFGSWPPAEVMTAALSGGCDATA